MIAFLPLAIEQIASAVGICDASSKMTKSNKPFSAFKYCDTVIGLINIQGASVRISAGVSSNNRLSPIPRRLVFTKRWKLAISKASALSVVSVGKREISFARICSLVSFANSSIKLRRLSTFSSDTAAENLARTGSSGTLVCKKFLYTFFSKLSTIFSLVTIPFSNASVMKVKPALLSANAVFLYIHQLASISMFSINAPAFTVYISKVSSIEIRSRSALVISKNPFSASLKLIVECNNPCKTGVEYPHAARIHILLKLSGL